MFTVAKCRFSSYGYTYLDIKPELEFRSLTQIKTAMQTPSHKIKVKFSIGVGKFVWPDCILAI